MTYFSNFPTIYYDYNINGVNESRVIRDISINLRFVQNLLQNITLFDTYDIKEGETPDIVSNKIYGSPLYHWVILLLNERFDYINDWPLTTTQVQQHVVEKYGVGQAHAIHHYTDFNGHTLTSTDAYYDPYEPARVVQCNLTLGSSTITPVTTNGFSIVNDWYVLDASGLGLTNTHQVLVDHFIDNNSCILNTPALETISTDITFRAMIDPMQIAMSFTNYEYEMNKNEGKRRIKLVSPKVLPNILAQLKALSNG